MASDVTLVIITLASFMFGEVSMSDEKRLIKFLLDRYEIVTTLGRPVSNISEPVVVYFRLQLIQILDLDEKNQVLTTNCWTQYYWKDELMQWNKSDFGGLGKLRIPTDYIWMPDIVLFNYADDRLKENRRANAVIESEGMVFWMPQAVFKSTCQLDVINFPFDTQNCTMRFGSWTFPMDKIDIQFMDPNDTTVDINDYQQSNEWYLFENEPAFRHVRIDSLESSVQYAELTYNIRIRRNAIYYIYVLLIPCILLSFLTLVVFWLPPEAPAKMLLGMNVFVAFFVLLSLLAEATPVSSTAIPAIGVYFVLNMVLITLSTFLAVAVINVYWRGDRKNKVPHFAKKLFIDWLARLFCMRDDYPLQQDIAERVMTLPRNTSSCPESGPSTRRGSLKSSKPSFNCPEMKYNKFQMEDLRQVVAILTEGGSGASAATTSAKANENVWEGAGRTRPCSSALDRDDWDDPNGIDATVFWQHAADAAPLHVRLAVESDVREIRRFVRQLLNRVHQKEERNRTAMEWRIVGRVLDRIFFFVYLFIILTSFVIIFSKTL